MINYKVGSCVNKPKIENQQKKGSHFENAIVFFKNLKRAYFNGPEIKNTIKEFYNGIVS